MTDSLFFEVFVQIVRPFLPMLLIFGGGAFLLMPLADRLEAWWTWRTHRNRRNRLLHALKCFWWPHRYQDQTQRVRR